MKVGSLCAPVQPDGRVSANAIAGYLDTAFATGVAPFEWLMKRSNGSEFLAEISLSRFEFRGKWTLQSVIRDISWRKEAEQHLRQLSRAVEQSPSAVIITDTNGCIQYVNPKFTALTGYTMDEVLGQNPRILKSDETDPEEYANLWSTITSGREWHGIFHNKKKNGELFWEAVSISPITDESGVISHFVAVKEDITERKQIEEKVLRADRMESIGSLAGGMAHDLNNILAPIMMSASLLHDDGIPLEIQGQLVSTIEQAAQRGADIVNQVLTFARGVKGERTVLNVQALVSQIGQFVKETFPKNINFSLLVSESLWNVVGDRTQLYQVLLNLCVNARDAMQPRGGTMGLTAQNCELDDEAVLPRDGKSGYYVKVTVKDTGAGISKEIVDRIFEPFFTTKEPGKGTGLGLSTVIGILRSHGGFVTVDSELGKGSAFNVFLPATMDTAAENEASRSAPIRQGRGETILVVDDEADILGTLKMVLTQNGWSVISAKDGTEGVAAYLSASKKIKAVLTDMIMPNMDGLGLVQAIRKFDPSLPILVASGFGEQAELDQLQELGVAAFLKKPFNARNLRAKMAEALYGAENGSN